MQRMTSMRVAERGAHPGWRGLVHQLSVDSLFFTQKILHNFCLESVVCNSARQQMCSNYIKRERDIRIPKLVTRVVILHNVSLEMIVV